MREIPSQVKTNIGEKVSSESNEIEEFYKLAFLKESEIIKLEEIKVLLADGRNTTLKGHSGCVRDLAITNDNQYLISGSEYGISKKKAGTII